MLYIDIDIHHGDGVQEAFLHTNRVLALSFHRYGQGFFPGAESKFEGWPRNVPQAQGLMMRWEREKVWVTLSTSLSWRDSLIKDTGNCLVLCSMRWDRGIDRVCNLRISWQVVSCFQPSAVVLQCGADSLAGDRLGTFSLSNRCH